MMIIFLALMNALGLILFGVDKSLARNGKRRISEACLLGTALLFGAAGCLSGMMLFHHKTRKRRFTIAIPVLLVLQISLIWVLQMGL